jgi:hypothetical protein
MSLDDIKNKLYKKEADPDLSQLGTSEYDPESTPLAQNAQPAETDEWKEKKFKLENKGKKAIKMAAIFLGIIILAAALAAGFYWYRKSSFSETQVKVEVSGPAEVQSGKLLVYEINYENNNRADLENAKLKITYPDSFKPEENPNFKVESPVSGTYDLGTINGRGKGKIVFNGRVYSPKGALIYIEGDLSFNPSSFSSQFVSKNRLGVSVISTPLELEVTAPQAVAAGDEVNYLVAYRNSGEQSFDSVKIKADYPDGFAYSNSDPQPFEGNNIWYIGQIAAGQSGKIVISGKLDGERDQTKPIKVYAGSADGGSFASFNEASAETSIASSPLLISQTVNGIASLYANAGDNLQFEINYKNGGDSGMRNVIITENLDSPVLDYSTLQLDSGSFNQSTKTITWKASDYKQLKNLDPGQGGTIRFSVKVKEILPISSANDKNFVISSVSKIDSPDVPTPINMNKIISGNRMDIRLNSKLVLTTLGFYKDAGIPNSGPVPPKANQETTYTLHWKIINVSNDISSAKVASILPTGAVFTGKISPEDASIDYDERTNEIVWNAGNISAATGILTATREVSFQVKIKPSPDQAGKEPKLLESSKITARDLFTNQDLTASSGEKTTNLPEDASLQGVYKVAE